MFPDSSRSGTARLKHQRYDSRAVGARISYSYGSPVAKAASHVLAQISTTAVSTSEPLRRASRSKPGIGKMPHRVGNTVDATCRTSPAWPHVFISGFDGNAFLGGDILGCLTRSALSVSITMTIISSALDGDSRSIHIRHCASTWRAGTQVPLS